MNDQGKAHSWPRYRMAITFTIQKTKILFVTSYLVGFTIPGLRSQASTILSVQ
jgi:hypothetical protein